MSALKSADAIVNAAPMGILPESAHRQTTKVLLPVIDAIIAEIASDINEESEASEEDKDIEQHQIERITFCRLSRSLSHLAIY